MNASKIVGFAIALIAAVLIAMAGRSCARDIADKNEERRQKNTTQAPSYHLITDPPVQNDPLNTPQLIEETTQREYVTVTNMLGEVVETIPVTTPEEADIPTTTLSMLDEYNQQHSELTTSIYEAPYEEIPFVSLDDEGFTIPIE
ncbi:hypothetical protein [Ruminococcus sp.]|uniref:hypothetical protein n=1 Tax=Ruminococcus sp. TaxID=41978 RepID=UPI0025E7A3C3|nr:hypothetical protein [Ruminococcus sp.]MCR4639067.1 hypothetical protein [Ruminococcus sp.]